MKRLPPLTRSMGPGLRSCTIEEMQAWHAHRIAVDEHAEWLVQIATSLLKESKRDGCQDPALVEAVSVAVSGMAADLDAYLEDMGDRPGPVSL